MFLSVVVLVSILDGFPLSSLNYMELFAFGVSGFSVVVSFIMAALHYNKSAKKIVGGTIFELVMAVLLLGLWIAAAVVILTPHHNIASTISSTGVEEIVQANLFFFTWFATFCNVYLVGSFFRDYRTYDLRVMGWASVLAASLMLVGISNHLKQGICDIEDGATCFRIKYSMTAAVALSVFSCIASVLSYKSLVKPKLGLVLASPTAVIYCFSLVLLTSASGPGRTLGTIHITTWIGAIISVLLLVGEFNDIFLNDKEMSESLDDPKKVIERYFGDDDRSTSEESA